MGKTNRRRAAIPRLGLLAISVVGLTAWVFSVAIGSAAGQTATQSARKATVITVTAGKPNEFRFTLSRQSNIPAGKISFNVTNRGSRAHSFKVCTALPTTMTKTCKGPATKVLNPRQSQRLTVTLKAAGAYEFVSSVSGDAASGMMGLLGIGVSLGGHGDVPACLKPVATTVTVGMIDYAFQMSQTTIPCGTVTFIEKNLGTVDYNFSLGDLPGKILPPGATANYVVTLAPGQTVTTQSTVPGQAARGMVGTITVTSS